ncbi:MAG: alpha-mannosidase [Clostridia bacterium]|nr:alpha-mannosidase [Clostridia bacterium]
MNMDFASRYAALKTKIGGNREKAQFEFTMGPTAFEKNAVTPMNDWNKRIISELLFAISLTDRLGGKYDEQVEGALSLLENAIGTDGVLTKSVCMQAENLLLPMYDDVKAYKVIYASHAHIDMNWMWGWQETVAVTLSTFRTILNLMKEYPGFTFSQSQASVYKIVEEYDPDMMEEIKARIEEGVWEVTANAWVETDKNMPDTESLIRHIAKTREYLRDVWGIKKAIKVDFSPDTFGHSRFVSEINNFGNVPYYYHCRGLQDELTLYRFKAPSGREVLSYKEPYWYNSGVNPDNGTGVFEMEKRCAGLKTALIVYGVGNHGGGPTRRDIESMLEMKTWPIFPTLKFGTIEEFFLEAESVRCDLPVIDHEMNAIFTGCYTTQSRIKLANRRAEAGLLESEKLSALAHFTLGSKFNADKYTTAWQNTLFTHFHDILTGSCVQESREYAMGSLAKAIAHAQTEEAKAFETISRNIDTSMFESDCDIGKTVSEGAGVGFGIANYAGVPNPDRGAGKIRLYTVFNPSQIDRKELVEFTVWDYNGDMNRLAVKDHEGNDVEFQLIDKEKQGYWDHLYFRMAVLADVPKLGHAVYSVYEKPLEKYTTHLLHAEREELPKDDFVLENEYIYARFDTGSGQLYSLVDKKNGNELLSAPAGLNLIHTEDGGMSAWRIGRYLKICPIVDTVRTSYDEGPVRQSVTFEQKVMHSTVKLTVSLDKGATALKYDITVDWHETYGGQEFIPVLTYRLPLKEEAKEIICDVPAGVAVRPARQIDVPALTGAYAKSDSVTAALISDCKYGFRLADNVLTATLINTAGNPDLYPERGIHAIKLFVALTCGKPSAYKAKANALITPMSAVPTARHEGRLLPKASLMDVKCESSIVTAVFENDGALNVRLYEAEGKDDNVTITAPFDVKTAALVDLDGNKIEDAMATGKEVTFKVKAYSVLQIRIEKQ